MALAIPLSFAGAIQEFGTSHFIGRTIDALNEDDMDEFKAQIRTWLAVIVVGSLFAGIRDLLYGISSEKIGLSVRSRFFESIIKKDTGFFDDRKVGDICKLHNSSISLCPIFNLFIFFSVSLDK